MKKCHICNKSYVDKYISQNYRRLHKNSDYFANISLGMTYENLSNNHTTFMTQNQFFLLYDIKLWEMRANIIIINPQHINYIKIKNKKQGFIKKAKFEKQEIKNQAIFNNNNFVHKLIIINIWFTQMIII